ncbi:MAG: hypothetical protein CVU29_00800 [Betaproteobacteria bacterium HGW-Betaproteobacteria-22]|nr:MAG: hypothetical protein CVU29_00800 [Betaproteobacteria bacterium HGW-Betaproteobacteria-22]
MSIFRLRWLVIALLISLGSYTHAASAQGELASPASKIPAGSSDVHEVEHWDALAVNPNLSVAEVLEKTYARNPKQALLNSRNSVVTSKQLMANAWLPTAPALGFAHQNDTLGSGRGEREWQAELELPVWLPNQRNNRHKVADDSRFNLNASQTSTRLQVAGQLRDALWDVAFNENNLALAQHMLSLANQLQSDVEKRHSAGELAKTDVMLAQQERLRAEKEQLRAEAELMHARYRYYLLTGLREIPANFEEQQSLLENYSQSPIWLEAESKVNLAQSERALAQIESREHMQVLLNMRSVKGGFDNAANESVGVKLRIPFGGEARSAPIKAAAELELGNALTERESLRMALEAAMHEAEHNLNVSKAELVLAGKQNEIAQENARLGEKSFRLGESDLVSLLRVQSQAFEAARAYSTRQIQLKWDIARYNQTVGVLP